MNKGNFKLRLWLGLLVCILISSALFANTKENFIETIYDAVDGIATSMSGYDYPVGTDLDSDKISEPAKSTVPEYDPDAERQAIDDVAKAIAALDSTKPAATTKPIVPETSTPFTEKEVSPDESVTTVKEVAAARDPNWWQYVNPLPPPNSTPEEIHAFAQAFPAEVSRLIIKNIYGIEIVGDLYGGENVAIDRWSNEQLFYTMWALHEMPPSFIKYTKTINRVSELSYSPGAAAYVVRGKPNVYICDKGFVPGRYERTLIHEMGHVWMFDPENAEVRDEFIETFWTNNRIVGTPPTSYSFANCYEDFAECVAEFWKDPLKFKAKCPERYEFILHKVVGYYSTEPRAFSSGTAITGYDVN